MRKSKPVTSPAPAPAVPDQPTTGLSQERGEYRPVTRADLADFGVAYFKNHPNYGKDPTLPARVLAFWEHHFDTKEIPGSKANPIQVFFHSFTHLDEDLASSDETPGCASGLNAADITAGFKGSRKGTKGHTSAGATSFMTAGVAVDEKDAGFGTHLVMKHLKGKLKNHYHVTTVVSRSGNIWKCRGNNQNNQICVVAYDMKNDHQVMSTRMPVPLAG